MPILSEAREALATAVTTAGLNCLPYPPDNPSPPIAFVDSIAVDFSGTVPGAGYFCTPGMAQATVVALAQRHDREASITFLEGLIPDVLDELHKLAGLRLISVTTGIAAVGGQDLPATFTTVQFPT